MKYYKNYDAKKIRSSSPNLANFLNDALNELHPELDDSRQLLMQNFRRYAHAHGKKGIISEGYASEILYKIGSLAKRKSDENRMEKVSNMRGVGSQNRTYKRENRRYG